MKDIYETLAHEKLSLSSLRHDEKEFLGRLFKRFEEGRNCLSFKQEFLAADSPLFAYAERSRKEPEKTSLYKVCDDLAKRLGIGQGYLVREEVVPDETARRTPPRELTTGEVAKLAGC